MLLQRQPRSRDLGIVPVLRNQISIILEDMHVLVSAGEVLEHGYHHRVSDWSASFAINQSRCISQYSQVCL